IPEHQRMQGVPGIAVYVPPLHWHHHKSTERIPIICNRGCRASCAHGIVLVGPSSTLDPDFRLAVERRRATMPDFTYRVRALTEITRPPWPPRHPAGPRCSSLAYARYA